MDDQGKAREIILPAPPVAPHGIARDATRPGWNVRPAPGAPGGVTEWSKVHAWRACVGFSPYRGFESLPLRAGASSRVVRPARCGARAAGRWWLGPAQDGVANPVRSGRKQRY